MKNELLQGQFYNRERERSQRCFHEQQINIRFNVYYRKTSDGSLSQ